MAGILHSSLLLLLLVFAAVAMAGIGGGEKEEAGRAASCMGAIGDCIGGGEFDLGADLSRRILVDGGYISYGALKGDSIPCSLRGASYYNCRSGANANPYQRGCSAITQCRS